MRIVAVLLAACVLAAAEYDPQPDALRLYTWRTAQVAQWKSAGDALRYDSEIIWDMALRCAAVDGHHHPVTGSLVVLTTAHLWRGPCAEHDRASVKCGNLEHLAAMCQACHLRYDRPHHVANARRTRRSKRATGDLFG